MKNILSLILLVLSVLLLFSNIQKTVVVVPVTPTPTQEIKICPSPTILPTNTPKSCPIVKYVSGTSFEGMQFIAYWEGFRNSAYSDLLGHCTVGFGHKLHDGPCKEGDWPLYVTNDQGWILFDEDIDKVDFQIFLMGIVLNQNQWDSLASIIFNMGFPNFQKSSIYKVLKEGKFEDVPVYIRLATCCADVLIKRRDSEAKIWESGFYDYPR
jgi:GH24 family phage-related lysozyme (muramidase)